MKGTLTEYMVKFWKKNNNLRSTVWMTLIFQQEWRRTQRVAQKASGIKTDTLFWSWQGEMWTCLHHHIRLSWLIFNQSINLISEPKRQSGSRQWEALRPILLLGRISSISQSSTEKKEKTRTIIYYYDGTQRNSLTDTRSHTHPSSTRALFYFVVLCRRMTHSSLLY